MRCKRGELAMKYKFSKREIMLMYILLCIVVVLGGWFFLLEPSLSEKTKVSTELSNKKTELISAKTTYELYRGAKEQLEKEQKTLVEITTGFSSVMDNEDIDQMLTGLALLHGLRPLTLNIDQQQAANLQSYTQEETNAEASPKSEGDDSGILRSVDVTMSVEGSLVSVYSLADSLKDDYSIKLRNFSYTSGEEKGTHVLDFTIYMLSL